MLHNNLARNWAAIYEDITTDSEARTIAAEWRELSHC